MKHAITVLVLLLGLAFATPALAASPDNSSLTAGVPNLVTPDGSTWTFGARFGGVGGPGDRYIMRNNDNSLAAGGYAVEQLIYNGGQMYVKNSGGSWYLWSGGAWVATSDPTVTTVLPPPAGYTVAQRKFDDHWAGSTLDTTKWYAGLWINNQYLNGTDYQGHAPLPAPFSGWTVGNTGADAWSYLFNWPYGNATNTAGASVSVLSKDTDGSLKFALLPNSYETSWDANATYVAAGISSFYSSATEISHTGGVVQFSIKLDAGLNYGSWPGVQCSSATTGQSGTDSNVNVEWGYNWIGTPLTSMGMGINNVTADASQGGTLASGVYQVATNNDWTHQHTVAIKYTGDGGTRQWLWYVDNVLVNTVPASQPTGIDYNCAFYMQMMNNSAGGWHSIPDANHPGPFYAWIADWQFY